MSLRAFLFSLVSLTFLHTSQAQNALKIISWYQNTADRNAQLGVTAIRLGCSSTPDFCFDQIESVVSSQDVSQLHLAITLDPNTSVSYAGQFSQWSATHPVLISIGFDDLVNRMEHLQSDFGIAMPGTVVNDTIDAAKSANPNLKFGVTMYEDQLDSTLLAAPNLPLATRQKVDLVHLYIHYRMNGPNYATYLQQTKTIFPNAKIIAGAYAFDRIDYLPCQRGTTTACTVQQEEDLFQQLFVAQLALLNQGQIDEIEFFPGYFGLEDQWPGWFEPRKCDLSRLSQCIANTIAMRNAAMQDMLTSFGPAGPLTSLSPRPLVFAVQDLNTASGSSQVTLDNPGTTPLSIASIALGGPQAAEFAETNTCTAPIPSGGSCLVNITFKPAGLDARTAQLIVTDNARRSPHSMDLQGVGANATSPQVLLTPSSLNFSNQTVGTSSAPSDVVLTNPGGGELFITSIVLTGTDLTSYSQTNNCGTSLAASATCTIAVTFSPKIQDNLSAQLVITDNAVGSPHTLSILGVGTDPPAAQAELSATVVTFDPSTVNTPSISKTVTVTNPGNTALLISSVTLSGTNSADFAQTNTCGASLAAGGTCTFTLTFKPSATGQRTAQVLIADNANGSPQSVTLKGTGQAPPAPAVTLAPTALTFASQSVQKASAPLTTILTNSGSSALSITRIAISGTNAADFSQTNTCGTSVAAAGTCTISVVFDAAATGSRSAQLRITDNAAGSPQAIALSGTATAAPAPVVALTPTTVTFPSQASKTQSLATPVSLSNTGSAALAITAITITGANAAEFTQTNTCGPSVAAAVTCTVSVVFSPASSGSKSAKLQISDNAAGGSQTVALNGTATDPVQADFALTESSASATVSAGQNATFTLSVAGSGGFNQPVSFSCSGLPAMAACSFTPPSVTPTAAAAGQTTATISTTARASAFLLLPWRLLLLALSLLALTFCVHKLMAASALQQRPTWGTMRRPVLAGCLFVAVVACDCGCGGGSVAMTPQPPPVSSGTPAGDFTVTITGQSGASSHSVTMKLTVR